jgi:hypothetical protein
MQRRRLQLRSQHKGTHSGHQLLVWQCQDDEDECSYRRSWAGPPTFQPLAAKRYPLNSTRNAGISDPKCSHSSYLVVPHPIHRLAMAPQRSEVASQQAVLLVESSGPAEITRSPETSRALGLCGDEKIHLATPDEAGKKGHGYFWGETGTFL